MDILPASTLERSRISLIRVKRSWPVEWTVEAYLIWSAVRLLSLFSDKALERISKLFKGVRSSWDMLARNSDLYLDIKDNCSAFSSRERLAISTSLFFNSNNLALSSSSLA